MPTRGSFALKGLDAYFEDLANAGQDVDQVVAELVTEISPFVKDELHANLLKTKQSGEEWTGETEGNIQVSGVQQDGNFTFIEVSVAPTSKNQEIWKEFGTARQAAEPFFRPTMRSHILKNKLKEAMKEVMTKFGLLK